MPPENIDELKALLSEHGLPLDLADRAAWGIALLPGGSGRSRLGGRPELPGEWPIHDGQPLTHLASLALDELPAFPGRAQLPADGTLVFFADFSEEHEGWGPAEATASEVEIVYIAPGTVATPAAPPAIERQKGSVPVLLNERLLRFAPVLTMPYLVDELPDDLEDAYDEFADALDTPGHLLLGEPVFLQDDPREPGELSLLQLSWDEALGFTYGDGGDISFFGTPEDLASGRWDRVKAMPESS